MTKACLYARYSSHSQTDRSIEGQIQDAENYARQNDIQIVKVYSEPARSGTHADSRPVFQQMIRDAEHHPWDVVLVWKLDRFARNRYDAAMYRAKLKKNNIRIESVMERIADTPEGIILESMLEGMAEYYSANLSENIKRGQRIARQNGEWHGGEPPLGFQIENKQLVENKKTAPVVRQIFEDYKNGQNMADIIRHLNKLGIKTQRNKEFTYSTLGNILKCERYIGITRYEGAVVNSEGVALIDEDAFRAVQEKLKKKMRNNASAHSDVDYILTDKVFCGLCGHKMIGDSGKSHTGKVYNYYACSLSKRKHQCDKHNEPKETLEDFVVDKTLAAINDTDTVNTIAEKVVECYNAEFNNDNISDLEKELEKYDRELEKLTDQLIDTTVPRTRAKIQKRMESISAVMDELEDELDGQKKVAAVHHLTEADVKAYIKGFATGDRNNPTFRKYLVENFVNSIYIYDENDDGGKILINYNICPSETVDWTTSNAHHQGFGRTTSKWSRLDSVRTAQSYRVVTMQFNYNRYLPL